MLLRALVPRLSPVPIDPLRLRSLVDSSRGRFEIHDSGEDHMRALMAGFRIHLAKPVEPQELVASLAMRRESRAAS